MTDCDTRLCRITKSEYTTRIETRHHRRMEALARREDGDRATPWLEMCHVQPWRTFGNNGLSFALN